VGRRGPARRQGAVLSEPLDADAGMAPRPRAGRRRPWRGGGRHHQARQPVRRGCRRRPGTAYERALKCDEQSAFGGIVAIGGPVDEAVAEAIAAGPQADVIIAPSYAPPPGAARVARKATACSKHRALSPSSASCGSRQCCARPGPDRSSRGPRAGRWSPRPLPPAHSGATSCWPGGSAGGPPRMPSPSSPTARRSVWVPVSSLGVAAEIAVSKAGERASGGAGASDAFFPSPTASRCWPGRASGAVVQPGVRCATPSSLLPLTRRRRGHGAEPVSATSGIEMRSDDNR